MRATLDLSEARGVMLGLRHLRAMRGLWRHVDLVARGRQPIYLDYPVLPEPRWGWGRAPHPELDALLDAGKERSAKLLADLEERVTERIRTIPVARPQDPRMPHWANGFLGALDAVTLYGFPVLFGARRYVEVGSGNSTKFVRRGALDHGLDLHITSIDPSPRSDIDDLCDMVVRRPLEAASLDSFEVLEANDIVVCDGSHRCHQNSDVTVFFLEVLPRLGAGVLVYLDDIFLPYDYPADWGTLYYSEQYLLAALLMGDGGRRYEVIFPGFFTSIDPDLSRATEQFWRRAAVPGLDPVGPNGFWLRVRA